MKKIFIFYEDCGRMGSLNGVFVSTDEEIESVIGEDVFFGEVLGKHSNISVRLEKSNFKELTADLDFIEKAEKFGLLPNGFNPFDYMEETWEIRPKAKKGINLNAQ